MSKLCNCGTHTKAACDFAGACGKVAAPLPAAPAPTEQAGEVGFIRAAQNIIARGFQSNGPSDATTIGSLIALFSSPACRAALAARQAPAEDEFAKIMSDANATHIACMMGNMIYNLSQKKGHMLTAADCEMFNNLREQWDAARQAPDSRDAVLEKAASVFDPTSIHLITESAAQNRIRALKGPAQ